MPPTGLPQRLSQKCLALIIPRIKQASATHQIKLSKLGKIKKHQNNSKTTQVNSELLKVQTATGQLTKGVNFSLEAAHESAAYWPFRSKGETNNDATLHPEQLHGITQVLYTAPLHPALSCRYGSNSPLTWALLQAGTRELPHERSSRIHPKA